MKCPNCEEEVDEARAVDGICPHCSHRLDDDGEGTLFDDAEELEDEEDV